jgi:hypothetical protein
VIKKCSFLEKSPIILSTEHEKVFPMIHYIEMKYPAVVFDETYSAKIKIPTYRRNGTYVSMDCIKRYINIHFGNYDVVSVVTKASEKILGNISCVNNGYKIQICVLLFINLLTFALKKNKKL